MHTFERNSECTYFFEFIDNIHLTKLYNTLMVQVHVEFSSTDISYINSICSKKLREVNIPKMLHKDN